MAFEHRRGRSQGMGNNREAFQYQMALMLLRITNINTLTRRQNPMSDDLVVGDNVGKVKAY
ncbi:hypothetical protein L1049_007047 [Liquidambar formosana]|uniref:Uncharacterized protein n=1 Tax=Liquidambar formosana TaxID=63359 RepID=A0AAP0RI43_LIQFO